eukprot:GHVL01044969.1.p1 GENE.GHVL01044969.1~~GHVL01044969.1.p1  ORF type:complete len:287 (-),score=37.93 GHVL01044969.1:526-1386(-)
MSIGASPLIDLTDDDDIILSSPADMRQDTQSNSSDDVQFIGIVLPGEGLLSSSDEIVKQRRYLRDIELAKALAASDETFEHAQNLKQKEEDRRLAERLQLEDGASETECRFCRCVVAIRRNLLGLRTVTCDRPECVQKGNSYCDIILPCKHSCGSPSHTGFISDHLCVTCNNETCAVCLDELSESPSVRLKCNHMYHFGCVLNLLSMSDWKKTSERIQWNLLKCPMGCGKHIEHNLFKDKMSARLELYTLAIGIAEVRANIDKNGLRGDEALAKYSFYMCNTSVKS